jgi:hypothetical protein
MLPFQLIFQFIFSFFYPIFLLIRYRLFTFFPKWHRQIFSPTPRVPINIASPIPTGAQECGKCCPLEEKNENRTGPSEQVFWTPWWRPGNNQKMSCSGLTGLQKNHLRSFTKTWSLHREAHARVLKLLSIAKYRFTEKKNSENLIDSQFKGRKICW